MIWKYLSLFFVFNISLYCDAAYVDMLTKCSVKDFECQKDLMSVSLQAFAKDGIPELGLSSIDPWPLEDMTVNILNVIDITLITGQGEGVKDCIIEKAETNFEKGNAHVEATCKVVTVKGKYKLSSTNPLLKNILGGESVRGEGNGIVKIEKLKLKADVFFTVVKRGEDIYAEIDVDKLKYVYDVKGKITFDADNVYVGDKESSKLVTDLMNQNWKTLMTSFGDPFVTKAADYIMGYVHDFFALVPLKTFFTDDMSVFVKE